MHQYQSLIDAVNAADDVVTLQNALNALRDKIEFDFNEEAKPFHEEFDNKTVAQRDNALLLEAPHRDAFLQKMDKISRRASAQLERESKKFDKIREQYRQIFLASTVDERAVLDEQLAPIKAHYDGVWATAEKIMTAKIELFNQQNSKE